MFLTREYKLKNVSIYTEIGTMLGTAIGYILHYIDKSDLVGQLGRGLVVGFFVGTAIGLCEEFLFLEKFRKKSYFFLLSFRTLVYFIIFVIIDLVVNAASNFLTLEMSPGKSVYSAFYRENFTRDLLIIAFISFIAIALLQIRRLHKPGDLIKYVTGKYHLPEEINKIFLFIDLKSSTAIAEKLGNISYSSFLIDYYHDMTGAILMSKAEIYQYVGDGIILTWSFEDGIKHSRCVNCFYDIRNAIEMKKETYQKKYGLYPQFKGALHAGNVSVTWIGTIKKEIVYHGDVLNTMARIQDACNRFNQCLLVSEYLLQNIELPAYLKSEFVDELQLKGKQEKIKVFGLKGIAET